MTDILEVENTYRYPPVGECIYCGATASLSDEHVIPYGLSGTLVLPQSSCGACADITSGFEGAVQRGFMHDARVVGDFPSRRKRSRPTTIEARLLADDGTATVHDVEASEAPGFMTLPTFARATVLAGKPSIQGINLVGVELLNFGKSPDQFAADYGATGIQNVSNVDATAFARLLAKIAYGYLIAELGLFPRAESPLVRLIAGEADDGGCWIGSVDFTLEIEKKGPRHALSIVRLETSDATTAYVVRVKLFANTGCTGYEILARMPGWEQFVAQPAD